MFRTGEVSRWLHSEGNDRKKERWGGGGFCPRAQHEKIAGGDSQALESAPEDAIPQAGHELRDQCGDPQLHPV